MNTDYFTEDKLIPNSITEYTTPSGRYKLVTRKFSTGKGSWDYRQGILYDSHYLGSPIVVNRNHSSFPFLFIENHPNGHDYLICGEDYQGQTILELDTRSRVSYLSESAKKGHAFCWAYYKFDISTHILQVEGCYWGNTYEFQFFDFSNPMAGIPKLRTEYSVECDDMEPVFNSDGTITCTKSKIDWDSSDKVVEIASITVFKREGNILTTVSSWLSDKEIERQKEDT